MNDRTEHSAEIDDRSPFYLAETVFKSIQRIAPAAGGEEVAWAAFLDSRDDDERKRWRAAKDTRQPVPLYMLQTLYGFGTEFTKAESSREFCAEVGRQFTRMFSFAAIKDFLKAVLASRGSFQTKIMELAKQQLEHYTGMLYTFAYRTSPREISLTLESSQPEAMKRYYEHHGQDAGECFANSFYVWAGVLDKAFSHVVTDYDPTMAIYSVTGLWGRMVFPVREDGLFTHQMLSRALVGYIGAAVGSRGKSELEPEPEPDAGLVMQSDAMKELYERIRRVSRSDETVMLRGESGTGKSFIASRIHALSPRRDKPFVEVGLTSDIGSDNMIQSDLFGHVKGAFTGAGEEKQGLFSLADGGTIFLDEIGDATSELQAKLLRVIESSTFKRLGSATDTTVDVRVVAATNRDLEQMVRDGTFRQDLYYRLNVIPIQLPPLRERSADIPPLIEFLLARGAAPRSGGEKKLAPGVASALAAYPWPGNIRELDHALKYAVAMSEGDTLHAADFPDAVCTFLEGEAPPGGIPARASADGEIINLGALREMIRSSDPVFVGSSKAPHGIPAHIEHAKRAYLAALIDEFGGDLAMVAKFWDRSSEKTLRKLIKEYDLLDALEAARKRGPHTNPKV
jgi:DNA-binding NtrC family response regulator